MAIFGDLERLLAQLYPLRVPIAIASVAFVIGLAWVGRRRGWFAAARRHPRLTSAIIAVVLAVGLPTGWVLGSPLLIRTELSEAAPPVTAGDAGDAGTVVASGTFVGADEFHFGMGTASLIEVEPGRHILRFEDFSVRNGPDLFVYLSPDPDGYAEGALELGALRASDGSFNYDVPAGVDVSGFRSAVVWCRAFSVLFATASFGPS